MSSRAQPTDSSLLSESCPPAVGDSQVWFERVSRRIIAYSEAVVTDGTTSPGPDGLQDGIAMYRRDFFKAVIEGRNGGVTKTRLEHETGLSVDGDNSAERAAAVRRLAEDAPLRGTRRDRDRQHVATHFT